MFLESNLFRLSSKAVFLVLSELKKTKRFRSYFFLGGPLWPFVANPTYSIIDRPEYARYTLIPHKPAPSMRTMIFMVFRLSFFRRFTRKLAKL